MSESHPVYVSCAAGNDLMADLRIRRAGALVEISAPPRFYLAPSDVGRLIDILTLLLAEISPPPTA